MRWRVGSPLTPKGHARGREMGRNSEGTPATPPAVSPEISVSAHPDEFQRLGTRLAHFEIEYS